ncbi:mandelate racemase/muconate lactonizing enzyme family protein [Agromyces sp. LHK192]|uniref:mandelate racemase/muconate lactonizing enzyme family protein n=1 Tax=Agromyces sp. LHK192 TaxID=2498704 RepID=UPI000FD7074E|nr:mandelate racemase/muconate lactonizing enzyme family protein [Agromyces sp. LHK192]
MTATIRRIDVRPLRAELRRPWGPDVRDLTFLAVEVEDSDGAVGDGFSWTPTIGAASVRAMLEHDIRDWAIGRPADATEVWEPLWRHLHEAGGGGVTTIAMAGLDLALWDLAARRAGASVADHLGRRRDRVRAYGSGINRHYPFDELVAQAERWVAAGFDAVKVKVGLPDLADDVARVRAVREVIGPDRGLMIDANQLWTLDQALRAVDALAPFGLRWIEEPLRADDLASHQRLAAHLRLADAFDVPIAVGENLYTRYRFAEYIDAGVARIVQPNIVRVGGITPFLEIAKLAESRGVQLAPHLLLDLSAQLAMAVPQEIAVEAAEDASLAELGVLADDPPVAVDGGWARDTSQVGLGLRLAASVPTPA